ncbi:hypothetical protein RHS03_03477, partial [Rhizoctonia solani]
MGPRLVKVGGTPATAKQRGCTEGARPRVWLVSEWLKPALMTLRDGGWDKNDTQRRATALGVYETGRWRRSEAGRHGMKR